MSKFKIVYLVKFNFLTGHTKSQSWMMGSKIKTNSFAIPLAHSSHRHFFSASSSKPVSKIHSLPLQTNGFSSISHANVPRPGISPLKHFVYVIIDYVRVGGLVDAIILCKDSWIIHKKKYVCESSYMHYLCIGRLVDDVLVC